MKRILIGALVAAMASTPVAAQDVVTLKCMMPVGGEPDARLMQWDVTLDEANKTVSWTHEHGSFQNPAIYTPLRISLVDTRSAMLRRVEPEYNNYFDRATGQLIFNDSLAGKRVGQCEKVTVKRAF